jgi:hypothetical protein
LQSEVSTDILTISFIKMAESSPAKNLKLDIFGWGTPLVNNSNNELQTSQVTVVDRQICTQTFNKRFCASSSFGGCKGDDGGAVTVDNTLYGLIDYKSDSYCETTRENHLFVDISEHRKWIQDIVEGNSGAKKAVNLLIFIVSFGFVVFI